MAAGLYKRYQNHLRPRSDVDFGSQENAGRFDATTRPIIGRLGKETIPESLTLNSSAAAGEIELIHHEYA
jgi:hypothetical protein